MSPFPKIGLEKWSPKDVNMKIYSKKSYQLNSNLTCLVRNFVLKLSCDIVPEVAKGPYFLPKIKVKKK